MRFGLARIFNGLHWFFDPALPQANPRCVMTSSYRRRGQAGRPILLAAESGMTELLERWQAHQKLENGAMIAWI